MSKVSEGDSHTIHAHRRLAMLALQGSDLAVVLSVLGFLLLQEPNLAEAGLRHPTWGLVGWLIGSLIVWHIALIGANAYRSHRLERRFSIIEILNGSSVGALGSAALALLFQPNIIRLEVIVHVWWISTLLIVAFRMLLWQILILLRDRGRNLRLAVVVGSGPRTGELIRQIYEAQTGIRVVGYVDDDDRGHAAGIAGVDYLGTLDDLPRVLASRVIDEVFVALPMRSYYDAAAKALRSCEEQGIQVRMPCDPFASGICLQRVDLVNGRPILSFVPSGVSYWYLLTKRLMDMAVSLAGLLLLAPLFLVVAVLIKLDSPGPVFFLQQRIGMNKRPFWLFKFRTMRPDSEAMQAALEHLNESDGAAFKIREDPRVTRLGRALRRWSIDELPQLVNVLLGEMSLVGPRPLPMRDVERFKLDWQRRRFSARPGITCFWQVSGRSSIPFDQWMELDMEYIDRRSLLLDLSILLRTIPAVLVRRGAY